MATQYYLSIFLIIIAQLSTHINSCIRQKITQIPTLPQKLDLIASVISPNRKFIQIFNNVLSSYNIGTIKFTSY